MKPDNQSESDKAMAIRFSASRTVLLLTAALLLGVCACHVRADEIPAASPEADASRLVEEVLRKAGNGDLADWTRSIMDRALERAGEAARQTVPGSKPPGSKSGAGRGQTAPLPAERHADSFAARRPASAEVLIFTSLSVPTKSWRQWANDAARSGAPLVLRGVAPEGLRQIAAEIRARLGGHEAGPRIGSGASIAIDPRLFRLFDIERVPAVVVVPGGVAPCRSRGCSDDSAPPHDRIAGNIGLIAALQAIAAEGEAGREVAKAHLERLTGDVR